MSAVALDKIKAREYTKFTSGERGAFGGSHSPGLLKWAQWEISKAANQKTVDARKKVKKSQASEKMTTIINLLENNKLDSVMV